MDNADLAFQAHRSQVDTFEVSANKASGVRQQQRPLPAPPGVGAPIAEGYTQALIDNPLIHRSVRQVKEDAVTFHEYHRLDEVIDVETFVRGAQLARESDPESYTQIVGLTKIERRALEKEDTSGFWHHIRRLPKEFRIILATCCLAAITQGWDQQSINGANLSWPTEFGLDVNLDFHKNARPGDVWIFGIVNAATYLSAAFGGCWLSDPLNEYFYGRRGAIFVASLFSFGTVIGAACSTNWQTLLICRVLLGFGMGAKASVVPIFISETAPTVVRGTLVICWQIFVTCGIFLGSIACLAVASRWRYQVASAFIPPLPLLILVLLCVESPRWLLKKGRYKDAYKSYLLLRETPLQACRDLYKTHCQIQSETRFFRKNLRNRRQDIELRSNTSNTNADLPVSVGNDDFQTEVALTGYWERFSQLFLVPRIRRATVAAVVVMISQQLCGINILSFLSSTVFLDAIGSDSDSDSEAPIDPSKKMTALWISFGFGLANFLFTWLAAGTIDKKGRRWLLNRSFPCMAVTLLATGMCFFIQTSHLRIGLVALFSILFTLAYSPGEGPVAFTLSAEVFPLVNREVGMSFAVFWNLLGAGILVLVVPSLAYTITHQGLLGLFAGLNLVCFALAYFLVPETARIGLEEMNYIFDVSTRDHISYQLDMASYTFNRYIRRRKAEEPPPLYVWAKDRRPRRPSMHRNSSSLTR
ncbi:MAG: hypothetical protein M1820_008975 [Bogoriella megaspora]|nr:MAG: hypothetical protein M1820_008975 [Bogoriella megaspora]